VATDIQNYWHTYIWLPHQTSLDLTLSSDLTVCVCVYAAFRIDNKPNVSWPQMQMVRCNMSCSFWTYDIWYDDRNAARHVPSSINIQTHALSHPDSDWLVYASDFLARHDTVLYMYFCDASWQNSGAYTINSMQFQYLHKFYTKSTKQNYSTIQEARCTSRHLQTMSTIHNNSHNASLVLWQLKINHNRNNIQ